MVKKAAMPAEAGIQKSLKTLDSRLHGHDDKRPDNDWIPVCTGMTIKDQTMTGFLSARE